VDDDRTAEDKPRVDITEGNVLWNVIYMGVPSMIGFLAMTVYGLTDIYWLGRLGTAQVAALTLFGAIGWVLGSTNQLIGTGSVALISRRYGERDYEATRDVIRQTILLKFVLAAVMAAVGLLIVPKVLTFMNAEPDARAYAITYANIFFYGLPFMFSSYTMYTALRGVGDAPKAMYIMLASTGLNVVLDPIFMFDRIPVRGLDWIPGLGLGIAGAALATVLSATVAVAIGLYVLATGKCNITVPMWRKFHPRIGVMLEILAIGGPAGLNSIMRSMAHWFVTTLVATFGTVVVAAYGIAGKIMEPGILIGVGLSLGVSAMVGQNLGAEKKERAHEAVVKATLLAMGFTAALGAIEFAFARQILGFFTSDADVIATGIILVRLLAIAQIWIAMHITMSAAFWGSGDTWPPTIIAGIIEWGIQIPLILLAIHVLRTTELGVWWAMFAASCVEILLTYVWFQRGKWKHRAV
jgi:putative MATE family efflux protein